MLLPDLQDGILHDSHHLIAPGIKFRVLNLAFRMGEDILDCGADSLVCTDCCSKAGDQLL